MATSEQTYNGQFKARKSLAGCAEDIAFILDYAGEGFSHVYTQGKVVVVRTYSSYAKYCYRLSEACWGETLFPSKRKEEQIWWVKVRLPNGIVGWTDKTNNFDGQDACA